MAKEDLKDYWHLRKLLKEFEKLDNDLFVSKEATDWLDAVDQTIKVKREIKRLLANKPQINVAPDLARKLKMIRDNYGYNIDKVFPDLAKTVEKYVGERISQEDEHEIDWVDELFTEGTADYVDWQYFRRKNQVGCIIGSQSLPEAFLSYLEKLKECYSLGLFEAAVIFCRGIIEAGVFEALKRRKIIRDNEKVRDIAKYNLKSLMERVKAHVSRSNHKEAWKVIDLANGILHSKHDRVIVSEDQTYDAIKSSFDIIEELYR